MMNHKHCATVSHHFSFFGFHHRQNLYPSFFHLQARQGRYPQTYRDDISDEQIYEFLDKIYNGKATQEDIDMYTRKLGDEVAKVYGW